MRLKIITLLFVAVSVLSSQTHVIPSLLAKQQKGSYGTGTQYWTKSSATGFDFGTSTDFSIVMQFKTTSAATLQRLISKKTNSAGAGDPGFMIEIRTSKISLVFGDAAASTSGLGSRTLIDGVPYYLVISATRSGSAVIYLNGTSDGSFVISGVGSVNNALTLAVGANTNGNNPVIGTVGRVQVISGKAFTASEVALMYAQRSQPLPTVYSSGTIVLNVDWNTPGRDISGTGNNLTPNGGPSIVRFQP